MTVIPCVIVHKRRSIGHASNLISIIPPRHNPGMQKNSDQQYRLSKTLETVFDHISKLNTSTLPCLQIWYHSLVSNILHPELLHHKKNHNK